jgi:DNA polymerase V
MYRLGKDNIMILQFPTKKALPAALTKVEALYLPDLSTSYILNLYSSRVSAGLPSPADDSQEEGLDLNQHLIENPDHTFYVRVSGESMIDAGISPGDLLVVDRSKEAQDRSIVIAVIDGELTVKRILKNKNQLFLMPENPNYPLIEITEDMDFQILGVATNVIHSLK